MKSDMCKESGNYSLFPATHFCPWRLYLGRSYSGVFLGFGQGGFGLFHVCLVAVEQMYVWDRDRREEMFLSSSWFGPSVCII